MTSRQRFIRLAGVLLLLLGVALGDRACCSIVAIHAKATPSLGWVER